MSNNNKTKGRSKNKNAASDPHLKREAKKYAKPIASREFILKILDDSVGPLTHPQLCDMIGISDDDSEEALRRRLFAMERDGQIHSNRKQAYACVDKLDLIRGRIQGHKDGFGFLIPTDGGEDIYLPYRQMRKVFDGDEALVRILPSGMRGRLDGKIIEVLARNTQQVVGRYFNEKGVCFVRPDNPRLTQDILIPPEATKGAKNNQFVMVDITRQPDRQSSPMGDILEVLGDHMAPGMEIDVAIRAHNLPHSWPAAVQEQAAQLPTTVAEEDKPRRVDLRDLHFVTIDGEDARDFDDAVYCQAKKSGGWKLYVAIADVSHYVTVDSALDQEAEVRSTSVYFPDFVLPMLPEALSNGLCSLNPKVDRLAMVCEINISAAGKVSSYQFCEAVIYSHARLTYTKVGTMLDASHAQSAALREQYADVAGDVDELYRLYKVLRQLREKRGAIDFETTETRIIFDEQRKIDKIIPVVRNDAHKLIEECMLCANVCAAKFLEKHELDGLYRVHEGPKEKKLENLRLFLRELGLGLSDNGAPKPGDYQRLVEAIAERPDAKVIQTVMLRSLSQAMYQPDNNGHFGLAYSAYTHFTSPIRRYPDLLTHRAIRHIIRSRKASKQVVRVKGAGVLAKSTIYPYSTQEMERLGVHTSMAERRADDATRDVVGWLKCEFLQDHIGDVFPGVVTAVTHFGIFVELLDVYVEGLVHITSLPSDYYHFEEAHHRLVGERTSQVFGLGDELSVRVVAVNLDERKVDFELEHNDNGRQPRSKKPKPNAKKKESMREKIRRGDFSDKPASEQKDGAKSAKKTKKSANKKSVSKKTANKKHTAKKKKSAVKKTAAKKATPKKSTATTTTKTIRKRKAKP